MKKIIVLCFVIFSCVFITACGHNTVNYSDGWGIRLVWNPSNSLVPEFDAGEIESLTAVVKENTVVEFEKTQGGMAVDSSGMKKPSTFKIRIETKDQINGYRVELEKLKAKN